MSVFPTTSVPPTPPNWLPPETPGDWGSLMNYTNWYALQKQHAEKSELPRRAWEESQQPLPLPAELGAFIKEVIDEYFGHQSCRIGLWTALGTHMISRGMDSPRVTAVVARTLMYLYTYLNRPFNQRLPSAFDGLQCFLRTILEAVHNSAYEMVTDYDSCPLLEDEDKPCFAAWMRCARNATQPGGSVDTFCEILGTSFTRGFGYARFEVGLSSV